MIACLGILTQSKKLTMRRGKLPRTGPWRPNNFMWQSLYCRGDCMGQEVWLVEIGGIPVLYSAIRPHLELIFQI